MTQPGHVLIIDDDPDFIAVYRELLAESGLRVTAVHTAEEASTALDRDGLGFDAILLDQRLDNGIEELDIITEYSGDEPPWKHDGTSYMLGECKNWSSRCGAPELRNFHEKLTTKFGRARTGFFFAPGGFTKTFEEARAKHAGGDVLVIPVDGDDLDEWIEAEDRLGVLRRLHRRAVLGRWRTASPWAGQPRIRPAMRSHFLDVEGRFQPRSHPARPVRLERTTLRFEA